MSWISVGFASAQIIPDTTLPTNSVVPPGCTNCSITGGTVQGNNLFHSFDSFSVPTGGSARFLHGSETQLIFSRVTGNTPSQIDGLLATSGFADLFFINPNGILFGSNAHLDVRGSFVSSSADRINFADGTQFVAALQPAPLLTVTTPVGLQFGMNPGEIINQANTQPHPTSVEVFFKASIERIIGGTVSFPKVGLQGFPGATVALIGGELRLEGGNVTAPGGHVELASLAGNSIVSIEPSPSGWQFSYPANSHFRDVTLSNEALVDVTDLRFQDGIGSGGHGSANVQGRYITLSDGSGIWGINLGAESGGTISVNASEDLYLQGASANLILTSSINTYTFGSAPAGDILVNSQNLYLLDGGAIVTIPFPGQGGDSGNINIQVNDLIEVSDGAVSIQVSPLPFFAGATGNGQTLSIETARLVIRDGGQISSTTFGKGNAGDIQVFASDSIELSGTTLDGAFPSGIFTAVETDGLGDAGDLIIETPRLTVLDGAQISSATRGRVGDGGDISITATEFVWLSGTSETATFRFGSSGIFVSVDPATVNPFTDELVIPTGDSGSLDINTPLLIVENGARISADTFSIGRGGEINLDVNQLFVLGGGQIRAGSLVEEMAPSNERGFGGLLQINAAERVTVSGSGFIGSTPVNSALLTAAEGTGAAGSLTMTTPQLLVLNSGEINVSAPRSFAGNLLVNADTIRLNQGTLSAETGRSNSAAGGANMILNAEQFILLENESLISARAFGDANGGNITINIPNGFLIASASANSDIVAQAFEGTGGNINISTVQIFGLDEQAGTFEELRNNQTNDISASSQFGVDGVITISNLGFDPVQETVELPQNTEQPPLSQGCQPGIVGQGRFINIERGGIPPSPSDVLTSDRGWEDIQPVASSATSYTSVDSIAEADGWYINHDGQLVLSNQRLRSVADCLLQ